MAIIPEVWDVVKHSSTGIYLINNNNKKKRLIISPWNIFIALKQRIKV